MNDTIAAISTALGVGAISIIRVSGENALDYVGQLMKDKDIKKEKTHTIHYTHLYEHDELLDEVMISIMRGPKTFTKEDTVEINCHGGVATTNKVLEAILNTGVRLAEPGEFTKRAFLNGRIDLVEAESVMDLIESKSDESRKLALSGLKGNISNQIENIRQKIVEVLANIEVNIDYPEYEDIEEINQTKILPSLENIILDVDTLINESLNHSILKDGIKTIIVGRPNVGKSSLLNCLLDEEKAIVTDIAGTTRDVVEGTIQVDGITLNMMDTAGIRKAKDQVEAIGVEKSLSLMKDADLILVVLNANEPLTKEDEAILKQIDQKKSILVVNKTDLKQKLNSSFEDHHVVYISALENKGLRDLKEKIKELFHFEQIKKQDYNHLTNARQISLIKTAKKHLEEAKTAALENMPMDFVELDVKKAWDLLGEIIGKTYTSELLDQLFSQFCLGK